ncbi:MAG: hypothetical protein KME16_08460 [Scytolyngbya sp. HA4215-MV1]|nr:hypothetical protein [Scytolyngbya sp. HA4215-MV1]
MSGTAVQFSGEERYPQSFGEVSFGKAPLGGNGLGAIRVWLNADRSTQSGKCRYLLALT